MHSHQHSVSEPMSRNGSGDGSHSTRPTSYRRIQTEKLQSIMAFLDEENRVSLSDDAKDKLLKTTHRKGAVRHSPQNTPLPTQSGCVSPGHFDSDQMVPTVLDDQEALILNLRLQLNKESERALQANQTAEESTRRRLKQQKDIYESKCRNMQCQITQLAEEKKLLAERCDTLAFDLKQHIVKAEQKLSDQEKRSQESLKNAKTQWDAAEKTRRQKWIGQRTQEIKENTLKSVEPEIQHVLDLHKDEIRRMQEHFEELVKESDARAEQQYMDKLREIDEAVVQRIENVRLQERDLSEHIMTEKITQLEKNYRLELVRKQEESRASKEISEERIRLQSEEISRIRKEAETKLEQAAAEECQRAETARADLEARHKKDVKRLQQELEERFRTWKQDFITDQEAVHSRRLEKETSKLKAHRDAEIAKAMAAMSDKMATLQGDLEKSSEVRANRLQERYQLEIAELNAALATWKQALQEAKEQIRIHTEISGNQRSRQAELEERLTEALKDTARLEQERRTATDEIRLQFSTRIAESEEELKSLHQNALEEDWKHAKELASLREENSVIKRENELALETINQRVHDLLEKRDAKIAMLRQQLVEFHSQKMTKGTLRPATTPAGAARAVSGKSRGNTADRLPQKTNIVKWVAK